MKKSSLMSLLLLSSFAFTGSVNAAVESQQKTVKQISKEAFSDVYAGANFQYFDKEDRLLIVNDFLKAVELNYAPLKLKEKKIGISFKQIKAEAIAKEEAAEDIIISKEDRAVKVKRNVIAAEQARLNMEFLDRLQILVAKFKDTHFSITENIRRQSIYNGLLFNRIEGKIVLSGVDKKVTSLVDALSGNRISELPIGIALIAVDGQPVEKRITELKEYIGASSDAFADTEAVRALTARNFAYPTKAFSVLTFENGLSIKTPYFSRRNVTVSQRPDALAYLKSIDVKEDLTSVSLKYDDLKQGWNVGGIKFEGYSIDDFGTNLKNVTVYTDDSGAPGMKTGHYVTKGKAYTVVQLFTFATKNLNTETTKATFIDALRNVALEAKEDESPVILDLRYNGGGNGTFPAQLLSVFTPANKMYPAPSEGLRITPYMRQLEDLFLDEYFAAENVTFGLTMDMMRDILDTSIAERRDYAPMFAQRKPILADEVVKGFDNDMVVLVSPWCVSACDMTAALFKTSKRAMIIGTQTNGTGAGYRSLSTMNTTFTDQFKLINTNIPNFLFGFPDKDVLKVVYEDNSVETLCSENAPTVADVKYDSTFLDLKSNNLGWLKIAAGGLDYIKEAREKYLVAQEQAQAPATQK